MKFKLLAFIVLNLSRTISILIIYKLVNTHIISIFRLNVRLKWPFRRIVAVAEFDFNPVESNQLPLKQGCQVIVLSKEGDQKGWWKGKVHDRVSVLLSNSFKY